MKFLSGSVLLYGTLQQIAIMCDYCHLATAFHITKLSLHLRQLNSNRVTCLLARFLGTFMCTRHHGIILFIITNWHNGIRYASAGHYFVYYADYKCLYGKHCSTHLESNWVIFMVFNRWPLALFQRKQTIKGYLGCYSEYNFLKKNWAFTVKWSN